MAEKNPEGDSQEYDTPESLSLSANQFARPFTQYETNRRNHKSNHADSRAGQGDIYLQEGQGETNRQCVNACCQ